MTIYGEPVRTDHATGLQLLPVLSDVNGSVVGYRIVDAEGHIVWAGGPDLDAAIKAFQDLLQPRPPSGTTRPPI